MRARSALVECGKAAATRLEEDTRGGHQPSVALGTGDTVLEPGHAAWVLARAPAFVRSVAAAASAKLRRRSQLPGEFRGVLQGDGIRRWKAHRNRDRHLTRGGPLHTAHENRLESDAVKRFDILLLTPEVT